MSVQIFLQGKLLGIEDFLSAPARGATVGRGHLWSSRSDWVTLLAEVLPRALLAELGLARVLLGASGGGGFLVVLPSESRSAADAFLEAAGGGIAELSGGRMRLVWAVTENLGDWIDVRKRLNEDMERKSGTPAVGGGGFAAYEAGGAGDSYFAEYFSGVREAPAAGWSPETPGRVLLNEGKHTWPLTGTDAIPMARHAAQEDDGSPASLETLASRASGVPLWGILRAAVDHFDVRLRRASTDAESIQLSLVFRQLLAGEIDVACSMGEYWRKVTVLYSGTDDFAVYGSWDALVGLAREMQRVFHRFAESNMKELAGPEGKTMSMAVTLAPEVSAPFDRVWEQAGRELESVRAFTKDSLSIFGRIVDWRQMAQASDLRDTMLRLIRDFDCPPQFLDELSRFYKDKPVTGGGAPSRRLERPWRFHRRFNSVLPGAARDREFQRIRTAVITDLIGKSSAHQKLRPAGGVAVHWTRLSLEGAW